MRFSPCLLIAACLSTRVSAFYPYSFDAEDSSSDSISDEAEELPDTVQGDNSSGSFTLAVRRVPIRRDNNHKIVKADKPSMANSVSLHQDGQDFSYFSTVEVGSESQEMWMLLDTGGTNTWVFGSDCASEACKQHRTFNESSKTLEKSDEKWNVNYGTGTVSGVLGNDSLSIAGLDVTMAFGMASNASNDLLAYPMDGILGLSRTNDSGFGTPTFMDVLANSSQLKSNIVSFSLSRASDGGNDGQVTFGDVDNALFAGNITYSDTVNTSNRWSIALDDASVNGTPINFLNKSAIIDTGTSYVMIPPDDAKAIHAHIPGANQTGANFAIPCDSNANITFTFSGVDYAISPKDYVAHTSDSKCTSTIIGRQLFGKDDWLVGDTFLKNVYTVFDFDQDRVGFAERAYRPDPEDESAESNSTSTASAEPAMKTGSDSDEKSAGNAMLGLVPGFWWPAVVVLLDVLCV